MVKVRSNIDVIDKNEINKHKNYKKKLQDKKKTSLWIDHIKFDLGKELDKYTFYRQKWINKHRNAR